MERDHTGRVEYVTLPAMTVDSGTPEQLLDLTEALHEAAVGSGLHDGVLHLWCPHTSAGLAVTEAEDGLHVDLTGLLERLAPRDFPWLHDDRTRRTQNLEDDRVNGQSHMRALLATLPSLSLPIRAGRLAIGRWQRVFLIELDGPRPRQVLLSAWGHLAPPRDALAPPIGR